MGFKDVLKQSFSRDNPSLVKFRGDMEKEKLKRAPETEEVKKKKEELDEQGVAYCPKCGSTVVGGALLGPLGLLAGAVGKNKVEMYCMKCGNKWKG
jgi:ribosomal protein L37AE/L43A